MIVQSNSPETFVLHAFRRSDDATGARWRSCERRPISSSVPRTQPTC
jgi:hypothetical protein